MRFARVRLPLGSDEFAVQLRDEWIPFSSLDLEVPDTASLIAAIPTVAAALRLGRGRPLDDEPTFACPVLRPSKILGIGHNYAKHVAEVGADLPREPLVFSKLSNALNGPFDPIILDHQLTSRLDYECELAVIVGRRVRHLRAADASSAIFGYAVANDVSARDLQRLDKTLSRSKSLDTFCPIGPWITSYDAVSDAQELGIRTFVNDEIRQQDSTSDMIFSVAELLVYLSRTMTLEPGDVILTGTPSGVALARNPQVFLQPGDLVRCEIGELGYIQNRIVAA